MFSQRRAWISKRAGNCANSRDARGANSLLEGHRGKFAVASCLDGGVSITVTAKLSQSQILAIVVCRHEGPNLLTCAQHALEHSPATPMIRQVWRELQCKAVQQFSQFTDSLSCLFRFLATYFQGRCSESNSIVVYNYCSTVLRRRPLTLGQNAGVGRSSFYGNRVADLHFPGS